MTNWLYIYEKGKFCKTVGDLQWYFKHLGGALATPERSSIVVQRNDSISFYKTNIMGSFVFRGAECFKPEDRIFFIQKEDLKQVSTALHYNCRLVSDEVIKERILLCKANTAIGLHIPVSALTYSVNDCIDTWKNYKEEVATMVKFEIKDVIFNNPATIVLWADGTKTVVKCQGKDKFDPEKGLAMCFAKKAQTNNKSYYDVFVKYVGRYNKKQRKAK